MTPLRFLATNGIMIGNDYMIGSGMHSVVVGFCKNSFGEWAIRFENKVTHSIAHDWKRPIYKEAPAKEAVQYVDNRKEPDAHYYKTKERHSELCNKKLRLNDTGRASTMRNAYINQELEMIRTELSKYKPELA